MSSYYGQSISFGGGTGLPQDLPSMFESFEIERVSNENKFKMILRMTPTSAKNKNLSGVMVVYNYTHFPKNPKDGTFVDIPKTDFSSSYKIELEGNATAEQNVYARYFPYNEKRQFNAQLEGSIACSLVVGIPAQVTDLTVECYDNNFKLTWKNPPIGTLNLSKVVCIQKEGSAPVTPQDGLEVSNNSQPGATVTVEGNFLYPNGAKGYTYFGIFTLNENGDFGKPVVAALTEQKLYTYSTTEPSDRSKFWVKSDTMELKVWNGTEWISMVGVYGE